MSNGYTNSQINKSPSSLPPLPRISFLFHTSKELLITYTKFLLKIIKNCLQSLKNPQKIFHIDPRDQILLKNSKCSESIQIKRERRPHRYKPNETRLGSNKRWEQEILCSVQNDKHAKKGMLTVQSVQSVRMLTWQSIQHVVGLSGRQLADVDE
jgi:hypothetical protein